MKSLAIEVRRARVDDVPHLSRLFAQLGYEVALPALTERFERMGERRVAFVAVVDGGIAGTASVAVDETLVGGFEATIESFVVDDRLRSRGVGSKMLAALESWARERGATTIAVRSNVVRERAHAFYDRGGYTRVKAQLLFHKSL